MATRVRIAAAACLVASGLLLGGAGAALALADPDAAHSDDTGPAPADSADGGTPAPPSEHSPVDDATTKPAAPVTGSGPKPTSRVGDGRDGSPRAATGTTPETSGNRPVASLAASPPGETAAGTTATTTPGVPPPLAEPTAGEDPEEHPGWSWWPSWWHWCWPTPPGPGLPPGTGAGTGNGGGGGVGIGTPPRDVGVPRAPALPVVPVDPATDVIGGLATGAAGLPLAPVVLPAVVAPLGAGAGGSAAGGSGVAPGPSVPRAPAGSSGPAAPPRVPEQSPSVFGANNGTMPATYRAGYGQYLRTAGVGELAAVAVPGVAGIVVLTLAGGVVGFRQARAGHAVRASGTARFMG